MICASNTELVVQVWPVVQTPVPCTCADLSLCAQSKLASVRDQATALQRNIDTASLHAAGTLEALMADVHSTIRSLSHRNVTVCWRAAYSDASIVRTASDLIRPSAELDDTAWLAAIRRLDLAIIVAGAPGEGRLDLIYDLIAGIQNLYLPITYDPFANELPLQLSPTQPKALPPHVKPIPRLAKLPSLHGFATNAHSQPFILPAFLNEWPARQESSWTSRSYLYRAAGRGRVVPVELGSDYATDDWGQAILPWEEFLTSLTENSGKPRYLAQHNIFLQLPALRDDIVIPDYVYADVPGARDTLALNAWLGPAGAGSPAHTDEFSNCYCVVSGRRSVWVAPPSVSQYMSANDNTSNLKVFGASGMHTDAFLEQVVPQAMATVLEPGDMLYLPRGWWHAIRVEDPSFAVSMWF